MVPFNWSPGKIDIDSDGAEELVLATIDVANINNFTPPTPVYVFKVINGKLLDITNQIFVSIPHTYWTANVVFGDFDGNNKQDIFFANHGREVGGPDNYVNMPNPRINGQWGEQNQVYLEKNGKYISATEAYLQTVDFTHGASSGDYNGDGRDEIFINNLGRFDGYHDAYVVGYDGVKFKLLQTFPNSFAFYSLSSDLNNDGICDVILNNKIYFGSTEGLVYQGDLPLSIHEKNGWIMQQGRLAADFNADGFVDIIRVMSSDGNNGAPSLSGAYLAYYKNNGDGTFTEASSSIGPYGVADFGLTLSAIDINFDGFLDIVVNSWRYGYRQPDWFSDPNAKYALINDGLGNFSKISYSNLMPRYQNSDWAMVYFMEQADGSYSVIHGNGDVDKFSVATFSRDNPIWGPGGTKLFGSEVTDNLLLTKDNDKSYGLTGNDSLMGLEGDDILDGGPGVDIAVFRGRASDYSIATHVDKIQVIDKFMHRDGQDILTNVERLKFSDTNIALDIEDSAGQSYRIYEAAFNRKPDAGGLGFWIAQLDKGATLKSVAEGFLGSAEFKALYGASPTNAAFVDNLYKNILDRAGEKGGVDYWNGVLNNGVSRADVLVGFSESVENKTGVIGSIQNGIEYKEWLG